MIAQATRTQVFGHEAKKWLIDTSTQLPPWRT